MGELLVLLADLLRDLLLIAFKGEELEKSRFKAPILRQAHGRIIHVAQDMSECEELPGYDRVGCLTEVLYEAEVALCVLFAVAGCLELRRCLQTLNCRVYKLFHQQLVTPDGKWVFLQVQDERLERKKRILPCIGIELPVTRMQAFDYVVSHLLGLVDLNSSSSDLISASEFSLG